MDALQQTGQNESAAETLHVQVDNIKQQEEPNQQTYMEEDDEGTWHLQVDDIKEEEEPNQQTCMEEGDEGTWNLQVPRKWKKWRTFDGEVTGRLN
jgi:hypothetical protein